MRGFIAELPPSLKDGHGSWTHDPYRWFRALPGRRIGACVVCGSGQCRAPMCALVSATSPIALARYSPYLLACPSVVLGMVTLPRSEEHTSELQSQSNLVCRLLLEKKKHTLTQRHM